MAIHVRDPQNYKQLVLLLLGACSKLQQHLETPKNSTNNPSFGKSTVRHTAHPLVGTLGVLSCPQMLADILRLERATGRRRPFMCSCATRKQNKSLGDKVDDWPWFGCFQASFLDTM